MLVRRAVLAVVVLALVSALVVAVRRAARPPVPVACTATVGGVRADLSPEQAGNAATISGVAVRRGLPARAVTIALATALQESDLLNLDYGDRDSLGLFQQRPSQGWGSAAQVQDPVHATNAFYDALVKVDGYRTRPITVVAQAVQRSGFPRAYAQHESRARVLASALTGNSPGALSCSLGERGAAGAGTSGAAGPARLTAALTSEQPRVDTAALPGRAGVRLRVRGEHRPWALAQWAVAAAQRLGVARVYADGRVWTRVEGARGWTASAAPGAPGAGSRDVLVLFDDVAPTG